MKIAAIRDTIRSAYWTRNSLTGGTRDEFIRQNVGGTLAATVAELRALVIAPRFAKDALNRDEEIARCEAVIARWQAAQPVAIEPAPYGRVALVYADGSRQEVQDYAAQVFIARGVCAHAPKLHSATIIDFAAERARRAAA